MALIMIALLTFTACGKEEPEETTAESVAAVNDPALLGTWAESVFDSGFIFNADGTGKDTFWDLTFTYTASNGIMVLYYDSEIYGASNYKYATDGYELTMTRTDTETADTFVYTKVGVEAPVEGEVPADGAAPVEGEAPADGAAPVEGEAPVEG